MKEFLSGLLRFRKLIITLALVAGFFLFYNTFLLDYILENLRFSLEQTALAYDIDDVKGLDMIITKAIAEELPPYGISSRNVANLEYAKNIIINGKNFHQLDYMKIALSAVIRQKEEEKGPVLAFLDKINWFVKSGALKLVYLPRYVFKPRPLEIQPTSVRIGLLEKLGPIEKERSLTKLASNYTAFVAENPNYERIALVKLRLGDVYQRLGEYGMAAEIYKTIVKAYFPQREARIAQALLIDLKKKDKLLEKANSLLVKSREISKDRIEERQGVFYELGMINMKIMNLADAVKFFDRVVILDSSSDSAVNAQFNMGWLYKQQNNFEESSGAFTKIVQERPAHALAFDSWYQLADIYNAEGEFEKSVDLLLKLADDYKEDPSIASLCLFRAAASYQYDLNDPEKAEKIFKRLAKDYPNTPYGRYASPGSPAGLFIMYLVPRATRVVAWRMMGLVCLGGYTGEIVKFKAVTPEEGFNLRFNNWLKAELPDTVGNLYVNISGQETRFEKGKAKTRGRITMGGFNVDSRAEWRLDISKDKMLDFVLIKAFLEKVPIPPMLINRTLKGLRAIIEKNIPLKITNVSMDKNRIIVEGLGNRTMIERIKKDTGKIFMTDIEIDGLEGAPEEGRIYASFAEKFPEGNFAPIVTKRGDEELFLDFFTRISLYVAFKLLETVKDSKLDYERSIRMLGQLNVKKENFRVVFKEDYLNAEIARYISYEFPWLIDKKFLIDVKELKLRFTDAGGVRFEANVGLGYTLPSLVLKSNNIRVKGEMVFEIDKESALPRWVFKEVTLNGKPFSVEKLNMLTMRCLNILKDEHVPISMEEIRPYKGGIVFQGRGAADFTARILYDPHPFFIFQIRGADLPMAGIQRQKPKPAVGDEEGGVYFRPTVIEKPPAPEWKEEFKPGVLYKD